MSDWPAEIECFMVSPTGEHNHYLRRFVMRGDHTKISCPSSWGFHTTTSPVLVGSGSAKADRVNGDVHPHDDDRWPTHCECGYEYQEHDEWQRVAKEMWQLDSDPSQRRELEDWGPGAMFWAPWYGTECYPERGGWIRSPEGVPLVVTMPGGGSWIIDAPASTDDGGYWTRSGTPPLITVEPSIWMSPPSGYHGWLRNGKLVRA